MGARQLAQEEEGNKGRCDLNGKVGAGSRSTDAIVSRNQIGLWDMSVGCVYLCVCQDGDGMVDSGWKLTVGP